MDIDNFLVPINWISSAFVQLSEHILPYLFFLYSLSYSRLFNRKTKYIIASIPIIIVVFSFFHFPIMSNSERNNLGLFDDYYIFTSILSIPLLLAGFTFMLVSLFSERNPRIRKQKKINIFITGFILSSIIINLYILRAFGVVEAWQINAIFLFIAFIIFLLLIIKNGALGMKINFQRQIISNTIDPILNGYSIYSHALKNEISKISLGSKVLENYLKKDIRNKDHLFENIEVINQSTDYLLNLSKSYQGSY